MHFTCLPQVNVSNNCLKLKKCLLRTCKWQCVDFVSGKECLWIVPLILGFAVGTSAFLNLFSRWTVTHFSALSIPHLAHGNSDTENQGWGDHEPVHPPHVFFDANMFALRLPSSLPHHSIQVLVFATSSWVQLEALMMVGMDILY